MWTNHVRRSWIGLTYLVRPSHLTPRAQDTIPIAPIDQDFYRQDDYIQSNFCHLYLPASWIAVNWSGWNSALQPQDNGHQTVSQTSGRWPCTSRECCFPWSTQWRCLDIVLGAKHNPGNRVSGFSAQSSRMLRVVWLFFVAKDHDIEAKQCLIDRRLERYACLCFTWAWARSYLIEYCVQLLKRFLVLSQEISETIIQSDTQLSSLEKGNISSHAMSVVMTVAPMIDIVPCEAYTPGI